VKRSGFARTRNSGAKPRYAAIGVCAFAFAAIAAGTFFLTSSKAPVNKQNGGKQPVTKLPDFRDAQPNEELAARIVGEMTDEELLAQILMFGWAGQDPSAEVKDWVGKRSLGSIKVFGWNTDNTVKVAQSITLLQKKAEENRFHIPLFVATDQEGGWIRHIKGLTTETPGNLAIGASGIPADAWYSGFYIGRELRAIGINLNFAPAVDLYTDHNSTVIGPRSFGESPEAAGELGASFVSGLRAAGVMATAKHFPGHGDTGADSHGRLPVIDIPKKTLEERELVPFRYVVEAGVPAIMSGHLNFPRITKDGEPATFSSYLLNDVLRGELGFKGLIITDDIMMNGATQYAGSVSRAVQMAIEAGNDIVESSTTPNSKDPMWLGTLDLMRTSKPFHARVADAAERVILAKLVYFKGKNPVPVYPDIAKLPDLVPDREGQKFFLSQAARSATIVRAKDIPFAPKAGKKTLIAGSFPAFLDAGKKRYPSADTAPIGKDLYRKARGYDTLIFCLASKESLDALKAVQWAGPDVIVISSLSPVLLTEVPQIKTAIAVYSYSPASFEAAFGALAGDYAPAGVMPLTGIN
jgi:beta-N-acetylhexosaminidase